MVSPAVVPARDPSLPDPRAQGSGRLRDGTTADGTSTGVNTQAQTAAALLDVQRACWLYSESRTRSPREALYSAGSTIDADRISRARRRASGWDRAAAALLTAWLVSSVLVAAHAVAFVVAIGYATVNSEPAFSGTGWLIPSGSVVLALALALFGFLLLCEHRTLLADRSVMAMCEADRLCALAWEYVDVGQLPSALLVSDAPKLDFMTERLWQHVNGVDEHMVRVLAAESQLSVMQLRQAVSLLS